MFMFFAFVLRVNFNFRRTNGSPMTPPSHGIKLLTNNYVFDYPVKGIPF
jgi:hypothetical protein